MQTDAATEARAPARGYDLEGDYPAPGTIERAYDEADLNRAVQTYRFFYPTVSGLAMWRGSAAAGLVANRTFGVLDTKPRHRIFTANSDTPYGTMLIDLRAGPIVIELPPGPLIVVAMDVNQRWVADMGLPGADAGNGGKHLLLPPGYTGKTPSGYHLARSATNRLLVAARSLPVGGDVDGALTRIRTIEVRPLDPPDSPSGWTEPTWIDLTDKPLDMTPLRWETRLEFWSALHEVIDGEPPYEPFRSSYGELAALGIAKGSEFDPDARVRRILERAAQIGNVQMRVESFADRRPDRVVWPDRKWEWAALRYEDGDFNTSAYLDLDARDKWFFQAVAASPAMFHRGPGAGSLYWLGLRDGQGDYLDGGESYRLRVPRPIPANLFWSVTVYDAESRCQIRTEQGRAALRSLFELKSKLNGGKVIDLYFGPEALAGQEENWIQTIPGKSWFAYFRIYGPAQAAFDGSWKPGDFERID